MTRLDVRLTTRDAHHIVDDPGMWLPPPARPSGHQTWITTLRVGPLHRQVTMTVGSVVRDGDRRSRVVTWTPGERPGDVLPFEVLLPSFTGELVAEDDELRVVGVYEPPAAWLGQVADVALRNAASHTVHHLLRDIVEAMASVTTPGDSS